MGIKYVSFFDENEIITKICRDKNKIEKLFARKLSLNEVINTAIGSNTYRVFSGNKMRSPSGLFKEWAFSILGQENDIKSKLCVETNEEFDLFFSSLCNDLLETWNKELFGMNEFRARKMVSLLLKNFCFWEGFNGAELQTYIKRVPLPLDSRTISAIRVPYNRIGNYKIPKNPTMGFIDHEEKYMELQEYMHYLAEKADIPVIYLDYLYYDFEGKRSGIR